MLGGTGRVEPAVKSVLQMERKVNSYVTRKRYEDCDMLLRSDGYRIYTKE